MYNNPFSYGGISQVSKVGLLKGLKSINWGAFLGNAQKTLGVINQAIPIVYQVKPIIKNAKTMFKIANTLKSSNTISNVNSNNNIERKTQDSDFSKPMFFL